MTFPDFERFGQAGHYVGRFLDLSVDGEADQRVKGLLMQYPNGRIGSLTVSRNDVLDPRERALIDLLRERCNEGTWTLEGLARVTPAGSYAWSLMQDAIAARRVG